MITYNRSAFGLNLIFQIHGSAVYRAVFPSLLSVVVFFIWKFWYFPNSHIGDELGHPYAVGALVGCASFLMVFRANQGYARYWEGCGAIHHMMSKWMDATVHAGVFHFQCDHYRNIKPPSYYEYPELNHLYLTRDRERCGSGGGGGQVSPPPPPKDQEKQKEDRNRAAQCTNALQDDDDSSAGSLINIISTPHHSHPARLMRTMTTKSSTVSSQSQRPTVTTCTSPSITLTNTTAKQLKAQLQEYKTAKSRKHVIHEEKVKRKVHAVVKSINYVQKPVKTTTNSTGNIQRRNNNKTTMGDKNKTTQDMTLLEESTSVNALPRAVTYRRTYSADDIDTLAFLATTGRSVTLDDEEDEEDDFFNDNNTDEDEEDDDDKEDLFDVLQQKVAQATTTRECQRGGKGNPFPLWGRPRLDGNWGAYYTQDKKSKKLATFTQPTKKVSKAAANAAFAPLPKEGFASMQGGRTPPLYLQELAHLSSLMAAVALTTLRNDVDGCESPLVYYEPGSDWPTVDPDSDDWMKLSSNISHWRKQFLFFLGMGRSPEEQTRYNAGRPLPVIGGVSDAEIRFLQMARGPYAKTQLCWNWLSEFMMREHLAGSMGKVGPPIVSRCIQFLGDGMIHYNHARKIMFVPFPFVHAQLSVLFILVMIPAVPFLMDQYTEETWLGAVLTFFTVLALAGMNEVARELENPFRNVPNELPLVTFMALYNEALITMYSGYHPDAFWNGQELLRRRAEMSGRTAATTESNESMETTTAFDDSAILCTAAAKEGTSKESEESASSMNGCTFRPFSTSPTNKQQDGVKQQQPPPQQEPPELIHDPDEIAQLKEQVAKQAKLIEQLFAQLGPVDPIKASQQLEDETITC